MKAKLITALETVTPGYVFLQGTLAPNEAYPEKFITFMTNYTGDGKHFDNSANFYEWNFTVNIYASDPAHIDTLRAQVITALKAVGFIPQGKGSDLISDDPTYTGWTIEFIAAEY